MTSGENINSIRNMYLISTGLIGIASLERANVE